MLRPISPERCIRIFKQYFTQDTYLVYHLYTLQETKQLNSVFYKNQRKLMTISVTHAVYDDCNLQGTIDILGQQHLSKYEASVLL